MHAILQYILHAQDLLHEDMRGQLAGVEGSGQFVISPTFTQARQDLSS